MMAIEQDLNVKQFQEVFHQITAGKQQGYLQRSFEEGSWKFSLVPTRGERKGTNTATILGMVAERIYDLKTTMMAIRNQFQRPTDQEDKTRKWAECKRDLLQLQKDFSSYHEQRIKKYDTGWRRFLHALFGCIGAYRSLYETPTYLKEKFAEALRGEEERPQEMRLNVARVRVEQGQAQQKEALDKIVEEVLAGGKTAAAPAAVSTPVAELPPPEQITGLPKVEEGSYPSMDKGEVHNVYCMIRCDALGLPRKEGGRAVAPDFFQTLRSIFLAVCLESPQRPDLEKLADQLPEGHRSKKPKEQSQQLCAELEGAPSCFSMGTMLRALQLPSAKHNEAFRKVQRQLDVAFEIGQYVAASQQEGLQREREQNIVKTHLLEKIQTAIHNAEPFMLPGAWEGHTVVYTFQRNLDRSWRLEVINTGKKSLFGSNTVTFYEKIPEDRLLAEEGSDLFLKLVGFEKHEMKDWDAVSREITRVSGVKKSSTRKEPRLLAQAAGTCHTSAFLSWMHMQMPADQEGDRLFSSWVEQFREALVVEIKKSLLRQQYQKKHWPIVTLLKLIGEGEELRGTFTDTTTEAIRKKYGRKT